MNVGYTFQRDLCINNAVSLTTAVPVYIACQFVILPAAK